MKEDEFIFSLNSLTWLEATRLSTMQTAVLLDIDHSWYVVDVSDVSGNCSSFAASNLLPSIWHMH